MVCDGDRELKRTWKGKKMADNWWWRSPYECQDRQAPNILLSGNREKSAQWKKEIMYQCVQCRFCPVGEGSWCSWQRNKEERKSKYSLPAVFLPILKPI